MVSATPAALLAESPGRLAEYVDSALAEFHPQTPAAVELVHAMAAARLLWERCRETETSVIKAEMARQAEMDGSVAPNILAMRAFSGLADQSQVLYLIGRHCESRFSRRYFIARDLLRREQARARIENENYKITERTKLPQPPTPVVQPAGPAKFVPPLTNPPTPTPLLFCKHRKPAAQHPLN
ncbi:MAG: hypothetical protein ABSB15_10320 [Bryobacteraceae bacterium]|jgi:hypothetical protein